MKNEYGEKLVSLNFERLRHWIGSGAHISLPVAELLGISGFYPLHPKTYMRGWRNRARAEQANAESESTKEEAQSGA